LIKLAYPPYEKARIQLTLFTHQFGISEPVNIWPPITRSRPNQYATMCLLCQNTKKFPENTIAIRVPV